jgi:hypothetical protein
MRIANPYFIPKKSRFGNPNKKSKIKAKNFHEVEFSKINTTVDPESNTQIDGPQSTKLPKKLDNTNKLLAVEENK